MICQMLRIALLGFVQIAFVAMPKIWQREVWRLVKFCVGFISLLAISR